MRFLHCAAALLLPLSPVLAQRSGGAPGAAEERPPTAPDPARARRGAIVFDRFCVSCHGVHGDGRGYSSPYLDPAPRDFTRGIFKWRSTPSDSLPTDAD